MLVRNKSQDTQFLSGFKAFDPGETRKVTDEQGRILLANRNFEEAKKSVPSAEIAEPKKVSKKK
jgi:hypothetical protein